MELAVSDLFVAGVGFDLVGGWLLVHGLILSNNVMVMRGTNFWGGNPATTLATVEDRIDAQFGLGSLLVGFALQALGYVLALWHGDDANGSLGRALTAFVLLVVVIVAAYSAWRLTRPRLLRERLVELAHWHVAGVYERPQREPVPYATRLCGWAQALGVERGPGEDDVAWAKRAFKISDARPGEPGAKN